MSDKRLCKIQNIKPSIIAFLRAGNILKIPIFLYLSLIPLYFFLKYPNSLSNLYKRYSCDVKCREKAIYKDLISYIAFFFFIP